MLDLRKPIAYFFLINSVILIAFGALNQKDAMVLIGTQHINLDVVWGGVMAAFGIFMYAWSMLESRVPQPSHQPIPEEGQEKM